MSDIAPRTLNIAGAQMAHAPRRYVFSVGKHARLCESPYESKRPPDGGLLLWQGHKWLTRGALCVFRGKTRSPLRIPIRKQKAAEWRLFVLAGAQMAHASRGAAMCFPLENTLAFADPHAKIKDHRMVAFYFGRGTKARTLDTRFWRPRKKSEKPHKYLTFCILT